MKTVSLRNGVASGRPAMPMSLAEMYEWSGVQTNPNRTTIQSGKLGTRILQIQQNREIDTTNSAMADQTGMSPRSLLAVRYGGSFGSFSRQASGSSSSSGSACPARAIRRWRARP